MLLIAQSGGIAVDLVVVLATAGLICLLLNRLKMPTIPGYVIAGAIIGPHAFRLIHDTETVTAISRISTILLMFIIGLELDLTRVKKGLFSIVGGSLLATAITALLGWGIALLFIPNAPQSLTLALAMAFSATAAPLRMMEQRHELHSTYGRLAFGITLFQDLIALAALAGLPGLVAWAGKSTGVEVHTEDVVRQGAFAVSGLAALIVVGKFGLPKLLSEASKYGGEVLVVISAAVAMAGSVFSTWLGFSPELGAFLAGFLLASTPFRYQLSGQLIPMRDLFLALFFTAVGLTLPLKTTVEGWWIVLLALLGLVAVKVIGITVASWALGASVRVGLLAAVTLVPAGEFTLVIIAQSKEAKLLDPQQAGYGVAVVVLSILASPLIASWGRKIAPRLERVRNAPWIRRSALREEAEPGEPRTEVGEPKFRVIIAGFGPVGRAVADSIQPEGVDITVIELNPNTVHRQNLLGRNIVYGDASNPEVLMSAGLERADAVILTMPDEEAMLRACRTVRTLKKDVFLAARANALSKGLMAMQLGADHAVVEEMATAEAMGKEVLLKVRDRMAGADTGPRLYEYR